ncbi:MAG: flavodoxin family protein [Anaerolineaceae bacterium]|nr:flavodoxin family protein [Anaerolineaceae bacterium]
MTERLVVYDSYFGNTEKIATAIGEAVGAAIKKVDSVTSEDLEGLKILFMGSPTRAFQATPATMTFLKGLKGKLTGVRAAAFETRIRVEDTQSGFLCFMIGIFGYATPKLVKGLQKTGAEVALEAEGFAVLDSEGPLAEGELDRARTWAVTIL